MCALIPPCDTHVHPTESEGSQWPRFQFLKPWFPVPVLAGMPGSSLPRRKGMSYLSVCLYNRLLLFELPQGSALGPRSFMIFPLLCSAWYLTSHSPPRLEHIQRQVGRLVKIFPVLADDVSMCPMHSCLMTQSPALFSFGAVIVNTLELPKCLVYRVTRKTSIRLWSGERMGPIIR